MIDEAWVVDEARAGDEARVVDEARMVDEARVGDEDEVRCGMKCGGRGGGKGRPGIKRRCGERWHGAAGAEKVGGGVGLDGVGQVEMKCTDGMGRTVGWGDGTWRGIQAGRGEIRHRGAPGARWVEHSGVRRI